MKPDNDTPAPATSPTMTATPAETAPPAANKEPRGLPPLHYLSAAEQAELDAEMEAATQKARAQFDADVSKWMKRVGETFAGTIRETRRIEAATRLACAMLRHGHAAADIPAKAVQFADLIIAEVDRTATEPSTPPQSTTTAGG